MYLECITDLYQLNLANFAYGGLVLDLSHFFILPQMPQKIMLTLKVVKRDSKVIIYHR